MSSSVLVLDIELPLAIRFGGKQMRLRDVAGLTEGGTVTFNRPAGDRVDLLVDDRVIARGEVVVSRGNYCVRITELAASGA